MEKLDKKMCKKMEDLTTEGVVNILEQWQMDEFVDFVKEKQLDGRKFLDVSEGIVKLWRPRCNANKLILFVQDLKNNHEKYLRGSFKESGKSVHYNMVSSDNSLCKITVKEQNKIEKETKSLKLEERDTNLEEIDLQSKASIHVIESQYQTVKKSKTTTSLNDVEELIKKIVPAKSFLYRNQTSKETSPSYLPMDGGTPKKRKNLFRISGYDYPKLDLRRFSKQDTGDRGYYPMKRNSRFFIQKSKPPEQDSRPKYKSLASTEELKYPEDHFYEDLCYNEVNNVPSNTNSIHVQNTKPYRVKIQEIFQSFKIPFFKKNEEVITPHEDKQAELKEQEKESNFYENSDNMVNMYDSVHVNNQVEETIVTEKPKLPVEDYLEPVQLTKDYCDVNYQQQRPKDETLLGYIMGIFANKFGYKRETNDAATSDSEDEKTEVERRWSEEKKTNMADRPLPVPVENEPYYMNIDRTEAENLLKGQLDGTFVLRPSSQANHAYTLSVSCNSTVHNVGIRRRPDGRLALGFARRGERSFADVASLLRHHKKRRLLLVANGVVIGATTLNESPQYYQTPCSIPVKVHL